MAGNKVYPITGHKLQTYYTLIIVPGKWVPRETSTFPRLFPVSTVPVRERCREA